MRKLSDKEPTVLLKLRLPESMKAWLSSRSGGASQYIRRLVERAMKRGAK